jgi:hypothetical protein
MRKYHSWIAAVGAALISQAALAGVIDLNAFSGSENIETLDTVNLPNWIQEDTPIFANDLTMESSSGGFKTVNIGAGPLYFSNIPDASYGNIIQTNSNTTNFNINFPANMKRVGLSIVHPTRDEVEYMIEAFADADQQVSLGTATGITPSQGGTMNRALFLGYESETPIASIRVTSVASNGNPTLLDDIRYEIPEPASIMLLILGLTIRRR